MSTDFSRRIHNGHLGLYVPYNESDRSTNIFRHLWESQQIINPVIGMRFDPVNPKLTIGALDPNDYEVVVVHYLLCNERYSADKSFREKSIGCQWSSLKQAGICTMSSRSTVSRDGMGRSFLMEIAYALVLAPVRDFQNTSRRLPKHYG